MAGDWIKMRADLADDPAVIEMAASLGMDEFAVVGRLHALWSWADSQSRDGHARGVTAMWIDRKLQRDGFAAAMVAVRWLDITEAGITFPNFENHNGSTAKARALGKNRKAKERSAGDGNDEVTPKSRIERDKSVTREEKRREVDTVPIGTDAAASTTAELTKAELWAAGKSLLAEQGMPKAQCGSFVGKLCADHGDAVVIEAVRATCLARPADAASYLKAACLHGSGQRKHAEPEWRAEQRQRTQQAAPGVAVGSLPADQFFIDVEARCVTARALD